MEKRQKVIGFSYIVMIGIFTVILLSSYFNPAAGTLYSDGMDVSHDDIFSGHYNPINIQTNSSVNDIDIYLDEEHVEHEDYNMDNKIDHIPTFVQVENGKKYGSLDDLEDEDSTGVLLIPKHYHFFCFWDYYYLKSYIVFDTQFIEESEAAELKYYISSDNIFNNKLYYYNQDNSSWVLIDTDFLNSEREFQISDEIINGPNLILKLTGYSSNNNFSLLIDKMIIECEYDSEFNEDIYIDINSFDDGYYNLSVELNTLDFNTYTDTSIIYIDNSAPEFHDIDLPTGRFNDTDIINFSAIVSDFTETNTILEINLNGTESEIIDFEDNTIISYSRLFLPGNYSYSLISQDKNGLFSIQSGQFIIELYEMPPDIVVNENTISVSVPSSVGPVEDYPIVVDIQGEYNYSYLCNITYAENNTEITTRVVKINTTEIINLNIFNDNFSIRILNINDSFNEVFYHNYSVERVVDNSFSTSIYISVPLATYEDDYNIKIVVDCEKINDIFSFKFYNLKSDVLVDSGIINDKETIYSELFDKDLLLKIYQNDTLIREFEFEVEKLDDPPEVEENDDLILGIDPILLIAIVGLIATITFGVLALRKND